MKLDVRMALLIDGRFENIGVSVFGMHRGKRKSFFSVHLYLTKVIG